MSRQSIILHLTLSITYIWNIRGQPALQSVVNQQSRPSESLFMCDSSELPSYGDAIECERKHLEQGQLFVKWIKMNHGQRSLSKSSPSKMTKRWKPLLPKCSNSNPRIGEPPALHRQCLLWCLATFIIVTIGVLLHAWCNLWLIKLDTNTNVPISISSFILHVNKICPFSHSESQFHLLNNFMYSSSYYLTVPTLYQYS